MTIIINIFGGPGSGKSTVAAGIFSRLKERGVSVEYVAEYAKDIVWEESFTKLNNQLYIFAKQHNRIFRCLNKVDVIVTDSPILLAITYGKTAIPPNSPELDALILHEFNKNTNMNVILSRMYKYDTKGRTQSEEEAIALDAGIVDLLEELDIEYSHTATITQADEIIERLFNTYGV